MRNPDPKPGRWVLPLVVLGMVLFTWMWVNRLKLPEVDETAPVSIPAETTPTTTAPGSTTETDEVVETTTSTTLLPPEIEGYLSNLADDKKTLAEVVAEMNAVNAEWEARSITYPEAESAMVSVSEQALIFSEGVEIHRPPDDIAGLGNAHANALDSATAVATAAEDALAGLRAPDDGELRRAALVEFRAAAARFNQTVDRINDIILQRVGL